MKRSLCTLALLLAACGCSPAQRSENPTTSSSIMPRPPENAEAAQESAGRSDGTAGAFRFRGLTNGTSPDEAQASVTDCYQSRTEPEMTLCSLSNPSLAGVSLSRHTLFFAPDGFDTLLAEFSSGQYEQVRADLTSAYGEPCHRKADVLQNGFGAIYENENLAWCFDGGTAILERYDTTGSNSSANLETSSFSYNKSGRPVPQPRGKTADDL